MSREREADELAARLAKVVRRLYALKGHDAMEPGLLEQELRKELVKEQ